MSNKLFGTDGIRGKANEYPLNVEMALSVGRAVANYFKPNDGSGQIIVGRDTRLSGPMIESALVAGVCSAGVDAVLAGIVPTPGVAALTIEFQALAGIVLSASHNPFHDNGIKIFNGQGFKLSEDVESVIEDFVLNPDDLNKPEASPDIGTVQAVDDALAQYGEFLKKSVSSTLFMKDFKVVMDCSNGATFQIAPKLFEELGAAVYAYFTEPNGRNINNNCGSEHPEILAEKVRYHQADIGLAFDGDGDRLIVVDDSGSVISGDQIMAICAKHMQSSGQLRNNKVVTTAMSNMGLGKALKELGVEHIKAKVGDRHVMEAMLASGAVLGGEDSGHMIFMDHHTTGDGILSALKLMEVIQSENQPLSVLKKVMTVFPQELLAVDVQEKPNLESLPAIQKVIRDVETQLDDAGRVLVRYSGTQPVCRVMVEGPTVEETRMCCQMIADVIRKEIGS